LYIIKMSGKEQLIALFTFLPSAVEPPPLGRILSYIGFNQLSKFSSVLEDIILLVFTAIELERRFDNEHVVA